MFHLFLSYLKNSFFLLVLGLVFTFCSGKKKQITQSWSMTSMEIAGQKVEGESVEDYGFSFKEDGSYTMKGVNGEAKGTWKISDDGSSLIITMEGKQGEKAFQIRALTEKGLTLYEESEGVPMTTNFAALEEK